jgi:DNA-binding NarL/FixJ family response regulator
VTSSETTASLSSASFQEFLTNASAGEIELLTELSLLDSFTADDAIAIASHPDVTHRLKQLVIKKILSEISSTSKLYQINSLIQDEFRSRLSEDSAKFKEISKRSAIALQQKSPLKSLELFGLAGDLENATKLINANLQRFLLHSDIEVMSKWAPVISKALGGGVARERLVKAYGFLASGRFDQLKSTLREIEVGLGNDTESLKIKEELVPIRLYIEFSYGNFSNISSAQYDSQASNWLYLKRLLLISFFYVQDATSFMNYYNSSDISATSSRTDIDFAYINSIKAMKSFLTGNYREASEFALAACNLAEELGADGAYFPFESCFILMDTSLEFGDEFKSQDYVDRYLPKAIRTHQYPWIAAFYAKAALIKAQAGKIDAALTLIRKGRESVLDPLFGPNITFVLDGHELIVRLPLGDMERIKELLFKLSANSNNQGVESLKYSLEIMSNPSEAERIAELMPNTTDIEKFRKHLLLSAAYIPKPNIAIEHLKKAIELAIPNGYFRAFLNMPPQVKDLILNIATATPTNYLENLARAILNQSSLAIAHTAGMEKPLTRQELVILRRLDSGLPITQIASALSISKNTIKTHLKSIYRKLAAESRHDAIIKAKELSLI